MDSISTNSHVFVFAFCFTRFALDDENMQKFINVMKPDNLFMLFLIARILLRVYLYNTIIYDNEFNVTDMTTIKQFSLYEL